MNPACAPSACLCRGEAPTKGGLNARGQIGRLAKGGEINVVVRRVRTEKPAVHKGFFVLFVFRVLVFGISFADRGAAGSAMCG